MTLVSPSAQNIKAPARLVSNPIEQKKRIILPTIRKINADEVYKILAGYIIRIIHSKTPKCKSDKIRFKAGKKIDYILNSCP